MKKHPQARSAVTGGNPEEMNLMPPDTNPHSEDPVHAKPREEAKTPKPWWQRPIDAITRLFGAPQRSHHEPPRPPLL